MTKLQDLVDQIDAEFQSIADAGEELSMSAYQASLRHIRSLAGQIFNRGRTVGAEEHASMIRQNLMDLANGIHREY